MKNLVFTTLLAPLIMAAANPAMAWEKVGNRTIVNPKLQLMNAEKQGLGTPRKETVLKAEISRNKSKNPKAFAALVEDSLTNPPEYQSLLFEVRDGAAKIEKAKILAKLTLLEAVRENRTFLEQTILNKNAVKSWDEFEYYLKRDLNSSTVYMPGKDKELMTFQSADWGRISIASNLRSANYHLDVMSRLDLNRLEPGADKIKTDKDLEFDSEEPEQAPVVLPTMAGPDREQVVPQLRKGGQ